MVTKLEFYFYYSKAKWLKKIVVNDYDTLKMSDFLFKAVKDYNEENQDFQIVEENQYYKIKLAEKNGKPDLDLPAISQDLVVKESNWTSFSINLGDEHFVLEIPKISDANTTNVENLNTSVSIDEKSKKENKKPSNQVEINENQGGICCCLLACFGKKK